MKDLVIFDFCETLIKYQTADRYVSYVLSDENINKSKFWMVISRFMGNRYFSIFFNKFFPNYNYGKRMRLLSLRSINSANLKKSAISYNKLIQKDLIPLLFSKMKEHIRKGDHVIIVSGGFKNYIDYFAKDHRIDHICATKIKINSGKCTGTFDGPDCMHDEKLKNVLKYIKLKKLKYNKSVFYTDSISDLELMQWVDDGIVVSRNKSQNWAKNDGFNEIIWKEF